MLRAWLAWLQGNPVPALQYLAQWIRDGIYYVLSKLDDADTQQRAGFLGNFRAYTNWFTSANRLRNSIAARLWWLYVRCYIDVPLWVSGKFAFYEKWSQDWFNKLLADVNYVLAMSKWLLHEFSVWLFDTTINPILARLKKAEEDILKYALTAYQILSTPSKLASLAFWPLFAIFQANPFTIGRIIGDWLAKLVYHNVVKTISLAETILTDVL